MKRVAKGTPLVALAALLGGLFVTGACGPPGPAVQTAKRQARWRVIQRGGK